MTPTLERSVRAMMAGVVALAVSGQSREAFASSDAAQEPSRAPSISIWLDEDDLDVGAITRVWARVVNEDATAPRSVTDISLHLPGFRRVNEKCWNGDTPACRPDERAATGPPWKVPPSGSLVLFGDIQRTTLGAGTFRLSGTYDWTDGAFPARRGVVEPLVVSVVASRPLGIAQGWLDFLRDLILPVTLVGIAWFLQRLQQRRSEQQVVWASMLATVHRRAEEHYLQARMAMLVFVREGGRIEAGERTDDALDAATKALLVLRKRMNRLVRRIGGFYLKDREGERLIAQSWVLFYHASRTALGTPAVDRLLKEISPFESDAQLIERRTDEDFETAYLTVRQCLDEWAPENLAVGILSLELCAAALDVELNRAYEVWYGRAEIIPRAELRRLGARLKEAAEKPAAALTEDLTSAHSEVQSALSAYLSKEREIGT